MTDEPKILKIFVAAPDDCAKEVEIIKDAVLDFDARHRKRDRVGFKLAGWDDTAESGRRNQLEINRDVDECDLFVLCMYRNWGAPSYNINYTSATEEEFCRVLKRFERAGAPQIFAFFGIVERKYLEDPGEKIIKIVRLKDIIKNFDVPRYWKIIYGDYVRPGDAGEGANGFVGVFGTAFELWVNQNLRANRGGIVMWTRSPTTAFDVHVPGVDRKISRALDEMRDLENERPLSLSESARKKALELALAGEAMAGGGRTNEAELMFAQALSFYPYDGITHLRYGNLLTRTARRDEALSAYDRAVELVPGEAAAHLYRAITLDAMGNYAEAVAAYDRAIGIDATLIDAYSGKATCLGKMGKFKKAAEVWEKVVELSPRDEKAHITYGKVLIELGKYQGAVRVLDSLIEIDPENASAYYHRACAYALWRKRKKAVESLKTAVELFSLFRDMATTDPELGNLYDDPDFKRLIYPEELDRDSAG